MCPDQLMRWLTLEANTDTGGLTYRTLEPDMDTGGLTYRTLQG